MSESWQRELDGAIDGAFEMLGQDDALDQGLQNEPYHVLDNKFLLNRLKWLVEVLEKEKHVDDLISLTKKEFQASRWRNTYRKYCETNGKKGMNLEDSLRMFLSGDQSKDITDYMKQDDDNIDILCHQVDLLYRQ